MTVGVGIRFGLGTTGALTVGMEGGVEVEVGVAIAVPIGVAPG